MRWKSGLLAGITAMFLSTGDLRAEENFTSADVLDWEKINQDGYIETSVAMAGIMASKSKSPAQESVRAVSTTPMAAFPDV